MAFSPYQGAVYGGGPANFAADLVGGNYFPSMVQYRSDGTVIELEKQVVITPGAPAPAGSDIVNASNGAISSNDLIIRDTNIHHFFIPMLKWHYFQGLVAADSTPLDADVRVQLSAVRHVTATGSQNSKIQLANFVMPGNTFPMQFGLVSEEAGVAQGGTVGADPATVYAVYSSALMKTATWLWLTLQALTLPTAGQAQAISIARKR